MRSRHARALRPILESPVASVLLKGPGGVPVRYEARENGIAATAGQGSEAFTAVLEWAFGAGGQGITPVGRVDGRYFEHRYSYYPAAGKMAPTFGHPARAETPRATLGLPQTPRTIGMCFNCHSTAVEETARGLEPGEPGVRCERCHGPGRRHAELAAAKAPSEEVRRALLNPGSLPARAEVEICGQCHRIATPGSESPEPEMENPVTVRFAPMGLMASRCFESGRLRCTTCHNPHEDARRVTDAAYAARCSACHTRPAKQGSNCRRNSGENCLPCHMRQASLGAYLKFTDHRIRIY